MKFGQRVWQACTREIGPITEAISRTTPGLGIRIE